MRSETFLWPNVLCFIRIRHFPTYFLFTFYYCHYYDYCVLLSYFLNGFKPYFHVDSHSYESCSSSSSIKEWTNKKQRKNASVCARVFLQPMKNEWFLCFLCIEIRVRLCIHRPASNIRIFFFGLCVSSTFSMRISAIMGTLWNAHLNCMYSLLVCVCVMPMCSNSI